jgi:hypothetical protein
MSNQATRHKWIENNADAAVVLATLASNLLASGLLAKHRDGKGFDDGLA